MRRSLAALFCDIVLCGIPLTSTHCESMAGCGCSDEETLFGVEQDDSELGPLLQACEASASSCAALCESALRSKARHVHGDAVSTVSCKLMPLADGGGRDGSDESVDAATDAGKAPARGVIAVYRICFSCGSGRLPAAATKENSLAQRTAETSSLDWFRAMTRLEAASVVAFEELAQELETHRAPPDLVEGARRARDDEIRHADLAASLAGQPAPTVREFQATLGRSLEQLAMLNASEGCVRETFGALVATYQAHHAADAGVRAALAEIAADESRHAELAWRLRAWFDERVGPAARARVAEVERLAWAKVEGSLEHDFPSELANDIGLPSSVSARHLLRELQCALAESRKIEARINGTHSSS